MNALIESFGVPLTKQNLANNPILLLLEYEKVMIYVASSYTITLYVKIFTSKLKSEIKHWKIC